MEEKNVVKMIERVTVAKFDHTHEDQPTVPVDVVTQETVTEISFDEAALYGFIPKGIEASGTVHLGTEDGAGPRVGD